MTDPPHSPAAHLRTGVFGGTFDPIHVAHLIVAECAREHFGLDRVLFIPTGSPPHKVNAGLSTRDHRLAMTRRAVADHPGFDVSDIEVRRDGVSFTIDTIRTLRAAHGGALYMIIGEDSLRDMEQWKAPEAILAECTVVVARRPLPPAADENTYTDRVVAFPSPAMDISSTLIRERVREGRSIRYLVPPAVEAYIQETGLYRNG